MEQLQPVNVAPPDLRDEMCGPHRKRPAAEDADDDDERREAFCFRACRQGVKPSSLVKERPGALKAVAVYLGPAKKSAETQFADARAKVAKLAKGKAGTKAAMNRDPHTAPLDPAPGSAAATAAAVTAPPQPARCGQARGAARAGPALVKRSPIHAPTPALQTAADSAARRASRRRRASRTPTRSMPGASDVHNPSLMSFAPSAAKAAEAAPLTATPDAKAGRARRRAAAAATAEACDGDRRGRAQAGRARSAPQKRAATGH